METKDLEFMAGITDKASWLFYGDLEENFDGFVCEVFRHEFREYGFEKVKMERDFAVAYWLFLSELVRLDLAEYGTSPRGAWLTENGKRFKKLCLEQKDAIVQTKEFIYKKFH